MIQIAPHMHSPGGSDEWRQHARRDFAHEDLARVPAHSKSVENRGLRRPQRAHRDTDRVLAAQPAGVLAPGEANLLAVRKLLVAKAAQAAHAVRYIEIAPHAHNQDRQPRDNRPAASNPAAVHGSALAAAKLDADAPAAGRAAADIDLDLAAADPRKLAVHDAPAELSRLN